MPTLLLSRSAPITLAEAERLPVGARVDNGPGGGQVALELPGRDLAALLQAAAALARAVPDAVLTAQGLPDLAAPVAPALPAPVAPTAAAQGGAAPADADPWALLDAGQVDAALLAFAREGLDPAGRERVRQLFQSTAPEQVAVACRIATAAGWRSFVTSIRRVLDHGDTRVRVAAVQAVGALAGPSMQGAAEKMRNDPSPDVRQAAVAAVAAIEGRQG
ncbi:hypothetical protein L6R53_07870 [Myxococcota bacterium]|nr:hypothetical protein [Myxococcota bacterium]